MTNIDRIVQSLMRADHEKAEKIGRLRAENIRLRAELNKLRGLLCGIPGSWEITADDRRN